MYYFKERGSESQLFSANFVKKLNKYSIELFFVWKLKIGLILECFLDFTSHVENTIFSKIQQD
ncbi:hypothetical protein GEZ74_08265 [Streptococcus mitis]|nr:hypothetical protein [Streptococcus mitis]